MSDKLRFHIFWPVALLLWQVEKAFCWLGNVFEDFATKDYARTRAARRPFHAKLGDEDLAVMTEDGRQ